MVNPIILDIIALAVIVLAILNGRKKGFVKMVWRVAAWILTLVLVMALLTPVTQWAMTTETVQNLIYQFTFAFENNLSQSEIAAITPEKISELTNIPALLIPEGIADSINGSVAAMATTLATALAETAVKLASALGLFIVIRIMLAIIFRILNLAAKLPVMKGLNKLLGMVMGFINIMFIVYIVLGIAAFYIEPSSQWDITINNTYLVKSLYNNNILINFIGL